MGYVMIAASIGLQILCIMHAYRTGRQQMWPLIILIFSLLGCFAYFVFEIMPELIGPNSPRAIKHRAAAKAKPLSALQIAEAQLAMTDSAANHMAVAEAHMLIGAYAAAADHFRKALDRMNGRDAKIEMRLAQTLFEGGQYQEALDCLDRQEPPVAQGEADRLAYLRARTLAELGQSEDALTIYSDVTSRLPGVEPLCRYAALLIETGKTAQARSVLIDVKAGAAKLRADQRREHADMLTWADDQLTTLAA